MSILRWLAVTVTLLVAPLGAHADPQAIAGAQSTIEAQLEAFLAGDGDAAYSHAAPNIMRMYPTKDAFMAMVQKGYPPVHRPRNYAFGRSEMAGPGKVVQHVLILGPDGKDYEAVYTLELQPDGVFRITGVSLRGATALST
jgi:hypothetical protein